MIPAGRLTLEEFLKLPERRPTLEYLHGQITQRWPQCSWEGAIQGRFAELVNRFAEPRRLAMAFTGVRATFAGASLVAPVGVYLWDKIPRRQDGRIGDDALMPWDIALEFDVNQPGIFDKCKWYVANGVQVVLLIDPDFDDMVERFGADGSLQPLINDESLQLGSVLPGFHLTPNQLFAALYPD